MIRVRKAVLVEMDGRLRIAVIALAEKNVLRRCL
jgi:hypothetical protein